jgi:Rieske Fe-S protein
VDRSLPRTPSSRRVVLTGGCAGALALCLGACARYGTGAAPAPPPPATPAAPGSAPGSTSGAAGTPVVAAAAVPVGGGVVLSERHLVVTQPTAGTFAAFDTTCPHAGCEVTTVEGGLIGCPCHGSRFRVADGGVVAGPAKRGLTARTATASDGQVRVV